MFRFVISNDHLSTITMLAPPQKTPHVGDIIDVDRVGPIVVRHVGSAIADELAGIVIASRA